MFPDGSSYKIICLKNVDVFRSWRNFLIVLVIYSAWVSPFELAFMRDLPNHFVRVDLCVDAFFLADIITTFFVAYLDRTTYVLVDKKSKIALRYLCSTVPCCILFYVSRLFTLCTCKHDSFSTMLAISYLCIYKLHSLWREWMLSKSSCGEFSLKRLHDHPSTLSRSCEFLDLKCLFKLETFLSILTIEISEF